MCALVSKQVILEAICETSVLFSTKAAGLRQMLILEEFAEIDACMALKEIIEIKKTLRL